MLIINLDQNTVENYLQRVKETKRNKNKNQYKCLRHITRQQRRQNILLKGLQIRHFRDYNKRGIHQLFMKYLLTMKEILVSLSLIRPNGKFGHRIPSNQDLI